MAKLGYILKQDIIAQISEKTLSEITGGRDAIGSTPATSGSDLVWLANEPISLEKMLGYTRHWYDMDTETRPIYEYSVNDSFSINTRVASEADEDGNRILYVAIADAPTGTELTNTAYFEESDDRNPVLVEIVSTLIIYNTAKRLNPRQLPEQRLIDYDNAIKTLKDIQSGKIQLNIPLRADVETDDAGHNVAWGDFEGSQNYQY